MVIIDVRYRQSLFGKVVVEVQEEWHEPDGPPGGYKKWRDATIRDLRLLEDIKLRKVCV